MTKTYLDNRWDWEREFEDAGYPGHHYTRSVDSVLILWGDGDEDYWRIEGISDEDARVIASAPDLLAICEEIAHDPGVNLVNSERRMRLYAGKLEASCD